MNESEAPARGAGFVRNLVRVARVSAVIAIVVGAAYVRVIAAGEREIAASTAGLKAGDPHEATVCARRAAGWYAPGAPHVRVAYERLIALATKAEGLGDRDTALLAWRSVRTAAIETTWIVTPHASDLLRADDAIARLSAAAPRPPGTRTEPSTAIEREVFEELARDDAPSAFWIIALVSAFVMWAGGSALVVRRSLGATGRIELGRAVPGLVVTGAGVALWILAIWRA